MKRAAWLPAVLLAGCTAGPDYHMPDRAAAKTAAATHAFLRGQNAAFDPAPLPDHWWRLYNDARLDGYVQEALTANDDLRAADANLRRASAVVREAEAGRTIQTRITGGAFAARVGGYTLTVPLELPYSAEAAVGIEYPVDLAGGIRRGIEAARDNREAVAAARDQVRVSVAAAVTRSYADVCSANLTLAATRHVLDVQTRTLSSVTRLFNGGRGTAFDVTRSRSAADQSAAALVEIVAARQASLFELAALMGRPASAYPRELADCASQPTLLHPLPIGDGTALIRRRPDIHEAERQLAAATAAIGIQTAKLYPQITLAGSAGLANSVAILNPPYIADSAGRAYRDGGAMRGGELGLRLASEAAARLVPGGRVILYTGSAIVNGEDPFRTALEQAMAAAGCDLAYRELDPDVFGEELDEPAYAGVERIAAVGAVAVKRA